MDDDSHTLKSDSERKEESSSEDIEDKTRKDNLNLQQEKDPVRILQLSQQFFAAGTIDEDESMIIPSSQDTVPFLIPSTPCLDEKKRKPDPDGTITVLEETCPDFEKKLDQKSENQVFGTTYIESDLTQDLEDLDATQPIIPTSGSQKSNSGAKKDEEEDDDGWELKFSESLTQDLLPVNTCGNDGRVAFKIDSSVERPESKEEDSLPPTLSFNVKESPQNEKRDVLNHDSVKESIGNFEHSDSQSEDEIEPSQSCLSDYRGETITSFKLPSSTESSSPSKSNSVHSDPALANKLHTADSPSKEVSTENDPDVTVISDQEDLYAKDVTAAEGSNKTHEVSVENVGKNHGLGISDLNVKCENVKSSKQPINPASKSSVTEESLSVEQKSSCKVFESESVQELTEKRDTCGAQVSISLTEEKDPFAAKSNETKQENISKKSDNLSDSTISIEGCTDVNKVERMDIELEDIKCYKNVEESELKHDSNQQEKKTGDTNTEVKEETVRTEKSVLQVNCQLELGTSSKLESQQVQLNSESVVIPMVSTEKQTETTTPIQLQITKNNTNTPTSMLPPWKGSLRKPNAEVNFFSPFEAYKRKSFQDSSLVVKSNKSILVSACKDSSTLDTFLKSLGIILEPEKLKKVFSKLNDDLNIHCTYHIRDQKISLEYVIEEDQHQQNAGASPISSSSSTTSSAMSQKTSTLSGEMADISSSLSAEFQHTFKSLGKLTESANVVSSQETDLEALPKTSTQKDPGPTALPVAFGKNMLSKLKTPDSELSPIIIQVSAPKKKRGRKAAEPVAGSSSDAEPKPKRKRGARTKAAVKKKPETTEPKQELSESKARKPKKEKEPVIELEKVEKIEVVTKEVEMTTEEVSDDQEESNSGSILPGVKVMARWKDGYYYCGMVKSQESTGKWNVEFEDGYIHSIGPENLIKISILPKGTSVMAQSPDDFYDPGIVCGHFRESNKVGYEVELDNGVTRRYARSCVSLSSDQAKLLCSNRPPTTPATMTINLDNIVDGKRKRKSTQSPLSSPVIPPKKSPRVTRSKKPDSNLDSTADSSASELPSGVSKSDISETTESEEPGAKRKKNSKPVKAAVTKAAAAKVAKDNAEENSSATKTAKKLPPRSAKSKLFKDYAFLLTNADRKIIPKPEATEAENSEEDEDIVPFDKDELCSYIDAGGGMVLDKFDDIKKCNKKYIYLLANSYLRTMKYIQCIAAGISCIKHHWVQNCVYKGEIFSVKNYILPAGFSLVKQNVIEWHGKRDVFQGLKIALISAPESPFVYTWAPVLLAAKADFVQKWNLPSSLTSVPGPAFVDVLITNSHCPPDTLNSAKKRKIPIVSSEWIIQCLIMGQKLPYDAHPKFRYDFTNV